MRIWRPVLVPSHNTRNHFTFISVRVLLADGDEQRGLIHHSKASSKYWPDQPSSSSSEWMNGWAGRDRNLQSSFFLSSSVIIKDRQLLLFSYVICHGAGRRDQWLTRIKCDLTHHSHTKSTQKHNAGWLKADSLGIDFPCNWNYSRETWYLLFNCLWYGWSIAQTKGITDVPRVELELKAHFVWVSAFLYTKVKTIHLYSPCAVLVKFPVCGSTYLITWLHGDLTWN